MFDSIEALKIKGNFCTAGQWLFIFLSKISSRKFGNFFLFINMSILYVFDFDDTIVRSDSVVKLIRGGEESVLDSHAFASYKYQTGDKLDFSDFDRVSGGLIPHTMQILDAAIRQGEDVVIITARAPGAIPGLVKFFIKQGYESGEMPRLFATAGSDNKPPVLRKLLSERDYELVIVYEDALENIESLKVVADEMGVDFAGIHIGEDTQMKKIYEKLTRRQLRELIHESFVDYSETDCDTL